MLRKSMFMLVASAFLASSQVIADELVVEGISTGDASQYPARGLTKAKVEADWGEPNGRNEAVGEPPISSWEYAPFIVYFEFDRVLHTVAKRD